VYFFGKAIFAECLTLPRAALGKEPLCRVPDIWHSAKHMTLGKDTVSGIVVWSSMGSMPRTMLWSLSKTHSRINFFFSLSKVGDSGILRHITLVLISSNVSTKFCVRKPVRSNG
jgi:hypothetical protein